MGPDENDKILRKWLVIIPKWMVSNEKPYEQMDDLGVFPLFLEGHPYIIPYKHPAQMTFCQLLTVRTQRSVY